MRGRLALVAAVALAAPSAQAARRNAQPGFAEPGDIIAAEGAMAHLAADKGMKAAFQATAAIDAEIFAPQLMRMPQFAKTVPENQLAKDWHTRQLWMSCDGSYGVSYGEWRMPPALGWYVMVWHRQKGAYKWVLNENGPLAAPLPDSDMIAASVADCPARRGRGQNTAVPPAPAPATVADYTSHHAEDGTMAWTTTIAADNSQSFTLLLRQDGVMREVLHAGAAPPGR